MDSTWHELVARDFPALRQRVHGHPVAYLDTAATAQKPQAVIDAITRCYTGGIGNVHRSVHAWGTASTEGYEAARATAARFLGATSPSEVVFTRSATEALNLLAQAIVADRVRHGDRVVVTELEHHSNLLPWQALCRDRGADLVVLPSTGTGELDDRRLAEVVDERTRVVAVAHVSNALGTVLPVERVVARARAVGACCVVDGAQAAAHLPIDVRALGCDAYVLSGHKVYGPSGTGVLWATGALLEAGRPWQTGGDMALEVSLEGACFRDPPHRFEAGTPNVAGVIGLGAALEYLLGLGMAEVRAREAEVLAHLVERLRATAGVRLVGDPRARVGVVSFVVDGVHPHDVGTLLDAQGIAIRAGHHCAAPALHALGHPATVRASIGVYTRHEDVERLVAGLASVQELFA